MQKAAEIPGHQWHLFRRASARELKVFHDIAQSQRYEIALAAPRQLKDTIKRHACLVHIKLEEHRLHASLEVLSPCCHGQANQAADKRGASHQASFRLLLGMLCKWLRGCKHGVGTQKTSSAPYFDQALGCNPRCRAFAKQTICPAVCLLIGQKIDELLASNELCTSKPIVT
eukprot:151361-Amphidinium_carterae.1